MQLNAGKKDGMTQEQEMSRKEQDPSSSSLSVSLQHPLTSHPKRKNQVAKQKRGFQSSSPHIKNQSTGERMWGCEIRA